jgi:hypothetical protein
MGNGAIIGGGLESDDGFAARGILNSLGKLLMTTGSAIKPGADGFGTALTGQVDFQSRVYSHHFVVAAYNPRVIDYTAPLKFNRQVVIKKVIQAFGAQGAIGYQLIFPDSLFSIGYYPCFVKIQQSFTE